MADSRTVVLNPVLRLLTSPITEKPPGGGKSAKRIKEPLYSRRRAFLIDRLSHLALEPATKRATHSGRVLVWAGLDKDSQAPTHTPADIFSAREAGAHMVAAWRNGYVVEFGQETFKRLRKLVEAPTTVGQRCDIFCIERLEAFATVLGDQERMTAGWEHATPDETGRRAFNVRLAKYLGEEAHKSVIRTLVGLATADRIALPASMARGRLLGRDSAGESTTPGWLPPSLFEPEVNTLVKRAGESFALGLRDPNALEELVLSGSIVRWEPVAPVRPTTPGDGPEPDITLPPLDGAPIVGMIDGGYHSTRYQGAVAWRQDPPLVPDTQAARAHGNKVASVLVDGHLWSNQLNIPQLHCRLGVVQAVAQPHVRDHTLNEQTLNHVERAFRDHPDTHVWNLSANIDRDCDDYEVSELGHGLTELARKFDKLLVISAGNRDAHGTRVAPPADCEAALIVSGRGHDANGEVAGACTISRTGLGPEGMLKPETSWFSELRTLGGGTHHGTSFSAPLVSRLAAHTWANLAQPNPDLVKALLINATDLDDYSHELGFGSPIRPELPWTCSPNAAIAAWSENITARQRYYWTGIRIPPSLMRNGRFIGRAKLVAVLAPLVDIDGHHYFQTRLQAGLGYRVPVKNGKGKNESLVGCANPKQLEIDARRDDNKWDPVRVYTGDFTRGQGRLIPGSQPSLHVYAQLFWRDAFKYSQEFINSQKFRASFVVMLESPDAEADTYNEFRRIMAENVETALIEQEIEVEADDGDI